MIKHEDGISQDDKRNEIFIATHQKKITHGISEKPQGGTDV